ncbi:hypothetical protein [Massilia alkalitolerans]|uniref:hypothetical protein n=1 Tax=Massilia alkalitolerans TaxID=286638 RepID=UPI0028AF4811|nr:hypothetical protein [Massilia alkalitolerans]
MDTKEKLRRSVVKYRKLARRNYYAVFTLYAIAVLSSVASTLLAVSKAVDGLILALVTALPASVILAAETFKFSEKARWHYEKKNKLNAILRLAEVEPLVMSDADIATAWNKIDASLEESWPGFGGSLLGSTDTEK